MASDLNHMIQENQEELGHFIAEKAGALANLMSGSNGRDKICALVQYSVKLYSTCMTHSEKIWQEEQSSIEIAERIVENISQGRKIFKFLKYIEPLRKMHHYATKSHNPKPKAIKILTYIINSLAFFLYFSDNIVWFANMGIINKRIMQKVKWKRVKDFFALWKNIIEIIKYLLDQIRNLKMQYDIEKELKKYDDSFIQKDKRCYDLVKELLLLRSKSRFYKWGIFQNVLRILMLIHRLHLPLIYRLIHPISVCLCGIFSNLFAIIKLFREKKQFIKIKKYHADENEKMDEHYYRQNLDTYHLSGNLEYMGNRQRRLHDLHNNEDDYLKFKNQYEQVHKNYMLNEQMQFKSQLMRISAQQRYYQTSEDDAQSLRSFNGLGNNRSSQFVRYNNFDEELPDDDEDNDERGSLGQFRYSPQMNREGNENYEENDMMMSVENEDNYVNEHELYADQDEEDDQLDLEESESSTDEAYDKNAKDPQYKLFSLRNNSCIDYNQLIKMDHHLQQIPYSADADPSQ